jgi:hypothetical protein
MALNAESAYYKDILLVGEASFVEEVSASRILLGLVFWKIIHSGVILSIDHLCGCGCQVHIGIVIVASLVRV